MTLAHCILGKFLGVVCHCFPPPLDVPTFAARCLYVHNDARDPSSERWNCEWEICPVILPKFRLPRKFRYLLHAQIYDMGQTALLPLRRKACWGFFRPKNPTASAGFEPANLGTKGQHSTPRPPKPIIIYICICIYIHFYTLLRRGTFSSICVIQPTEISLKVYNMHLYYDHTLYSFPLYTFLWTEDDPQWPKHVVVSLIK